MMVAEVAAIGGCAAGGVWLWGHGHGGWAVAVWVFAALTVASIASTAIVDDIPLKEVAARVGVGLVGGGYLLGLAWGCWWLHQSGSDGLAVLAGIFGLWGVPLGLAVVMRKIRGE